MNQELITYCKQFYNSQIAKYFINEMFANSDEKFNSFFNQLLWKKLKSYSNLDEIKKSLKNSEDLTSHLIITYQTVIPFNYVLSSQIFNNSNYQHQAKMLLFASIADSSNRYQEKQGATHLILKDIEETANLDGINERILSGKETRYFPAFLVNDLRWITKGYFPDIKSHKSDSMIENHYIFTGLTEVFLKLYFDLIAFAETDQVTLDIYNFFRPFFINLKKKEQEFWDNFESPELTKSRLKLIINRDKIDTRHPVLRKNAFKILSIYNPILNSSQISKMGTAAQKSLDDQFNTFHSFSDRKILAYLNTVLICKASAETVNILNKLTEKDPTRINTLFRKLTETPEIANPKLDKLIRAVASKIDIELKNTSLKQSSADKITETGTGNNSSKLSSGRIDETIQNNKVEEKTAGLKIEQKETEKSRIETTQEKLYKKALELEFTFESKDENNGKIEIYKLKVKDFILLPIPRKEQLLFLKEFGTKLTPELLDSLKNIENNLGRIPGELTSIYDKSDQLIQSQLLKLIAPNQLLKLFEQKLISLNLNSDSPKISVIEFFKLPFGEREKTEENWFENHLSYLDLLKTEKMLEQEIYDKIKNNLSFFPRIKYKRYFNIFNNGKLEKSVLYAVLSLIENNGIAHLIKE